MTGLFDVLLQSAGAALAHFDTETGGMPAGHNGPYHDPETPVRNTGHWLITFLKAHEISGEMRFLEAARRAIAYLCSESARPMKAAFWHRKNPEKDFCNGLVGQAWTIEALSVAAKSLKNEHCQRVAEEVFLLHPFDEAPGLWRRVNVDGSYLPLDMTFNHQLWFAAAGALLLPSSGGYIEERVGRFMDALPNNLSLYSSGLVCHPLFLKQPSPIGCRVRLKRFVRGWVRPLDPEPECDEAYSKSIGYHAFNLYAFALLKQQLPQHPFWRSESVERMLAFLQTEEFVEGLEKNKFGYPYNPPGFEVAFTLEVFGHDVHEQQEWWISEQIRRCYDFGSRMMSLNTEDPLTHAARLYEATRLPDLTLHVEGMS